MIARDRQTPMNSRLRRCSKLGTARTFRRFRSAESMSFLRHSVVQRVLSAGLLMSLGLWLAVPAYASPTGLAEEFGLPAGLESALEGRSPARTHPRRLSQRSLPRSPTGRKQKPCATCWRKTPTRFSPCSTGICSRRSDTTMPSARSLRPPLRPRPARRRRGRRWKRDPSRLGNTRLSVCCPLARAASSFL